MKKIVPILLATMGGLLVVIILFLLFVVYQRELTNQYVNKVPLGTILAAKVNDLKEVENNLWAGLEREFNHKYEVDFEKELLPLIETPTQILVLNSQKESSYDYFFIIDTINVEKAYAKVENFKKTALNIWARLFPFYEWKALPDKTLVQEIIAKPEEFSFQSLRIDGEGTDIFFLSDARVNFDLAYSLWQDKLLISTSKEYLIDFLEIQTGKKQEFLDLGKIPQKCYILPEEFVYLNSNLFLENQGAQSLWHELPEADRPLVIYEDRKGELNYCYY